MQNNAHTNFQIIDTASRLEEITLHLEKEKTIAVDIEADSMYHFKEKICLIQMASKKLCVVIDPLKVKDLSPLKPFFSRHDIQKIFHGADYDVRSLYRDFNIEINNLFDTELACRFLGMEETGLGAVLQKHFNLHLDKKYQKKDWSRRPLPTNMVEYAARDVIYLVMLAEILGKELKKRGRLFWVHEECEHLCRVRPAPPDRSPLFRKVKGAGKLEPRGLAILEGLLQFRKGIAIEKDKPLFKVIRNESLIKIAKARPITKEGLIALNTLSKTQIDMYGNALVSIVKKALERPQHDLPVYPRKKVAVLKPAIHKKLKTLRSWRDAWATELEIDPAVLFNKALLAAIAIRNPVHINDLEALKEMKNWQKKEFGQEIIAILKKVW
jgi:ribonuclease D